MQKNIGQSSFAVIDMCNDRKVSDFRELCHYDDLLLSLASLDLTRAALFL
jgi:hypothetical protein